MSLNIYVPLGRAMFCSIRVDLCETFPMSLSIASQDDARQVTLVDMGNMVV